jgi:prepilin-type N-terminal cleavage/methylation domain-containing protein
VANRTLRSRGFSLIELMAALGVASIVAVLATMSLAAASVAVRRHLVTSAFEDRAWLALAAIARDLESVNEWHMCTEARDCPKKKMAREYGMPVLVAGDIGWLVADELRRCDEGCQTYVDGVTALEVIADVAAGDGLTHRLPFLQLHEKGVRALEVSLTMRDGRRFSRVVSQRAKER